MSTIKVKKKRNKFGAVRTTVDGIVFHSKAESQDYVKLKAALNNGKITDLELQPKYNLLVNGIKIGTYKADFKFYDVERKEWVVADRKGFDTPLSKRSRKHVKAQYGIDVEIWK